MLAAASLVSVGRIAGPYGIRGWLKVVSYTEPADNLFGYTPWRLRHAQSGELSAAELLAHKAHGKGWVVQLAGIADRDVAAALRGMEIVVARDQLPRLESDSFYWADLEGMAVVTAAGEPLGRVDQLLETGSADVMVVVAECSDRQPEGKSTGKRTLVPFVLDEIVLEVDLVARRIRVNWDSDEDS